MAKQLNIDMRFNADTSKAKQAINDLEQSLQKLGHATMPKNQGIDPAQFEKASAAARELEYHLKNAFNAKTGNLDLSKLHSSLQQSKTSLKDLTSNFSQAGAVGQQAFTSLARAIATADQPTLTLNTHLSTMWTTLKNVARFQLSSSIMHGLIGGIQQAYGYAQDLNQSLNNIRIVTGQNTDQMARFAEQANKGARALSTTTLDYTDAALIYYQQGLSNEEVVARTETTLKLANVSRQSAEEVSSQMTAIWNNFDDGSHKLEYYADVITKLGATTAASSEEIANGVSKFAAVAETVGLSYEYAASALATIVAETRQSEETVGNGLRTLFARFEGLQLGKTLEDGVDLNKYSKALKAIGVNVLDANGNLRQMDDILDDMGSKWDYLTDAQKVALAQTVGGVRQYTNLIALMDNYDKFKANVTTALDSEGTVEEQAKIYAESWEGARDRVRAAAESIFSALIDDKFFIKLTNGLESVLVGVKSFIDNFGGIKGVLSTVLSFVLTMTANKIGPAIQKVIQDIQILTGGANKVYTKMQNDTDAMINGEINRKTSTGEDVYSQKDKASLQGSQVLLTAKTQLAMVQDKLSVSERMQAEIAISGLEQQVAAYEELGQKIDDTITKIKKQIEANQENYQQKREEFELMAQQAAEEDVYQSKLQARKKLGPTVESSIQYDVSQAVDDYERQMASWGLLSETIDVTKQLSIDEGRINELGAQINNELINALETGTPISEVIKQQFANFSFDNIIDTRSVELGQESLKMFSERFKEILSEAPELQDAITAAFDPANADTFYERLPKIEEGIQKLFKEYEKSGKSAERLFKNMGIDSKVIANYKKLAQEVKGLEKVFKKLKIDNKNEQTLGNLLSKIREMEKDGKKLDDIFAELDIPPELRTQLAELMSQMKQSSEESERLKAALGGITPGHMITISEAAGKLVGGIGSASTALRGFSSLFNALTDTSLNFGEAFTQALMSVSMIVPGVTSTLSGLGGVITAITQKQALAAATTLGFSEAEAKAMATSEAANVVRGLKNASLTKEQAIEAISLITKKDLTAEEMKNAAAVLASNGVKGLAIAIDTLKAVGSGKLTKAMALERLQTLLSNTAYQGNFAIKAAIAILDGHGAKVAIALAAAVAIGAGAIIMSTRASKAAAEAKAEEAKKNKEAAEAAKEEADAHKKLYQSYQDALKTFKETGEGKEELDDIARQLADAYNIENAALLIQAGRYEELNELLRQNQQLEQERLSRQANQNLTSAYSNALEQSTVNGNNYWQANSTGFNRVGFEGGDYSGNLTGTQVGGFLLGGIMGVHGDATTANGDMAKAYQRALANGGINTDYVDAFMGTGDLVFRTTDTSTAALIAQYEAIQATMQAMEEMANEQGISATELDGYEELNDYLADNLEWYQQLIDARKLLADSTLDEIFIDSEPVTNLMEYNQQFDKYKNKLIELNRTKNLGFSEEDINNLIESYMGQQYSDLAAVHQASLQVVGTLNETGQDFEEWFNSLTKEEQELVLKIIPVVGKTVDINDLFSHLESLSGVATFEELQARNKIIQDLITLNDSGTATSAQWEELYNKNPDFFKNVLGYDSVYDLMLASTSQRNEAFRAAEAQNRLDLIEQSNTNAGTVDDLQEKRGSYQTELTNTLGNLDKLREKALRNGTRAGLISNYQDAAQYNAMQFLKAYIENGGSFAKDQNGSYIGITDETTGKQYSGQDIADALWILQDSGRFVEEMNWNKPTVDDFNSGIWSFVDEHPQEFGEMRDSFLLWNEFAADHNNGEGITGVLSEKNASEIYEDAFEQDAAWFQGDLQDYMRLAYDNQMTAYGNFLLSLAGDEAGLATQYTNRAIELGGENMDGSGGLIGEIDADIARLQAAQNPEYGDPGWLTNFQTQVQAAGFTYDEIRAYADQLHEQMPDKEIEELLEKALEIKKTEQKFAEGQEVLNSLKNAGDIISAEDFAKLPQGLSSYFEQMEDGSYRLITSVDEVQEKLRQLKIDENVNAIFDLGHKEGISDEDYILIDQYKNQLLGLITTVGELQDLDADIHFSDEQLNQGFINLAYATEEGRAALQEYNYTMSKVQPGSTKAIEATRKFQKAIKDIQANKAAENIKKITDNLDELSDWEAEQIAKQLQTVFGKDVTADFVLNHKKLVKQWLEGTDEERQAAADTIDIMTSMQRVLNVAGPDQENWQQWQIAQYLVEQLEASSEAADMFASHWTMMQDLVTKGVAELNGITFSIDGSADMTQAIQALEGAEDEAAAAAQMIQEAGLSHVQFSINGTPIPDMPDFSDLDNWKIWYNENIASHPPSEITATGRWSQHAGTPQMTSGGSGGGGGGGGGGKNKSKEKKDPTDERDRYHTITEKIQDAKDAYDELSKAEDRAFGKERIKAMEGITNNLRLQIELQKQYLDEIRNYLEGDRAAVEALGATFDINGVITNYDDLIAELVAKYNEGVDAFNEGGLDEDAFKEQYEEPFNDAKEAIDQYVETINLLQSEELNLIDLQNDLADQLREIAAYKLELHINIDEDELKYLDFLLEMLGEDAEIAADRLAVLGDKFNTNRDEISAYTTAIQELLRLRGFSDEDVAAFIRGELTAGDLESRGFTSDDIDKLREYRDAIQDNTQAMKELSDEIEQAFLDTLDDLNDKVTDAADRFEHFTNMFEHFKNVVDIVGQDALGMSAETMKLIAKSAKENAIEMVKAAKTQLDSLTQVRQQAQAQLDVAYEAQKNATTAEEKLRAQESIRYWSETIEEVTNRVNEAQENLNEKLEEALEGIKDAYTTMVEQATKEFEKQITGLSGSLESLRENFDRQKETQELYIPAYEKIYELTKLTRDIGNSIDDTDNLWSKRELAKLQDEINGKMADGVELTEHDVEELRKRYELKLAEAALEEARDSKRTVRMSRDNEGNWSYVYTADENDVAAAEQNYEDKLYEYQQMNYEYIQELQDKIIQAEQDMTDQINDLDVTKFASKEAYLDAVNRIIDATRAKEQQYKDQLAQTLEQQNTLYEDDWARYNERTGYRMARDDQWVDNWNETILAQETGFETLEDMFDELTGAIGGPEEPGTYVGDITDAYAEMQASNERALNAAGTSMQTYESDVHSAISGISDDMEETQTRVEEFAESLNESMEAVTDFISEWKNSYGDAIIELCKFNDDLYTSCQKLISALQQTFGVNADFEAAQAEAAKEALAGSNRENSSNTTPTTNSSNNPAIPPTYKTGDNPGPKKYNPTGFGAGASHGHAYSIIHTYDDGTEKYKETGQDSTVINGGAGLVCPICGKMWAKDYQKNTWIGLKTGGYTGTWSAASAKTGMYTGSWSGPDLEENGRLAFLHQKELVLNASDTENFLSAVDMVRQISQTIDLQAASRSNWNFLLPGILGKESDTLDQNVHIEAHFPNVTSHSEIEEAFTNLVGKASQFANR